MISHDSIWQAIDRLAQHANLSTSGLARKAGLDPTAFNRSKRISPEGKPRWPSTESLSKILTVTGVSVTDFMTFVETRDIYIMQPRALRPMPHIRMSDAANGSHFDANGNPTGNGWDAINLTEICPLSDNDYTIEVQGEAFQPVYRDGAILIVSPSADIRRGDRVMLKTRAGELVIAQFERKSAHKIDISNLLSAHKTDISLALTDIAWIARILWASQ